MNYSKILLFLLAIICVCFNTFALELEDSNLFIKSDKLTLNKQNQTASFTNNVHVYFENIHLQASHLIVYYKDQNGKKSLVRIVIPGKFIAIKKGADEIVIADQGEYDVLKSVLLLKGNIKMQKNDNILVTDKMIYFTKIKNSDKKNNAK